jgi:hypothetical protein
MKWNNTQADYAPADNETVLISVNGVYYITIYDAEHRIFRLRDMLGSHFDPEKETIYWTEFISPE